MDIDLEFYKVFCEVAESQSFSKAAQKLYISQPAITQTIKKLEEQLGGKLFYRNNNGVSLTEEGKHLYQYIKDSMDIINNASNRFKQYMNLEEGIIRIRTGSHNARRVLYKALIEFCKEYSNIKIEISTGNPNDSVKLLSTGKIDMVILNTPYQNTYNNLVVEDIVTNEYIFVMSNKYALKNNVNIKEISDLNKYSLIIPKEETTARNILKEYVNNEQIEYKYEVVSEEMRKDLAIEGLGIAYVMKQLVEEELKNGKLLEIKLKNEQIQSKIGIVTLNNEISSFATKKLAEYIKKINNSK